MGPSNQSFPTDGSLMGPSNQSYPTDVSLTFNPYITALYAIVYIPVCFGIIFGNLLVIFAFFYHRELRKLQNYLLLSLAITDVLTGALALPLWISARLVISPLTCFASTRFNFFIPAITLCGSSVLHLLSIAVDRCLSLIWPLKYPRLVTLRRLILVISIIWLFVLSFACLPLYYPSPETDQWVCTAVDAYENEVDTIFLIISCALPCFVICLAALYAIMLRVAFKHIEKRRELTNQVDSSYRDARARMRGITTMAVVVGAFGVCWIPTSIKGFYEAFVPTNRKKLITVQTFAEYISFCSSMVNPLIYGYFNQQFKTGFKIVLAKWGCSKAKKSASARHLSGTDNISYSMSSDQVRR